MPDQDDELEPEHQQLPPDVQALLRQGRKAQRDLAAKETEVATANLHRAVAEAGIPEHPAREIVFGQYDGPMDAESIKAHAEKFGLLSAPATSTEQVSQEELNRQRQIVGASSGAQAPSSGDIDLAVALRNAKNASEVRAIIAEVAGNPGFKTSSGLIGVLPDF